MYVIEMKTIYTLVILFTMSGQQSIYEQTFAGKEACHVAATLLTADIREKGGRVQIADCHH